MLQITLQTLHHEIENRETEGLLRFLQYRRHARRSMSKVSQRYAIGTIREDILSLDEFQEIKRLCNVVSRTVTSFERLYFNYITLHTVSYRDGEGKCNSAYCCYRNDDNVEAFGEIQKFIDCPPLGTVAFIKPLKRTSSDILNASGKPCREILELYAETSVISQFIVQIKPIEDTPAIAIPVERITSNCVLITPMDTSVLYVIKLPNNYEHH